MSSPLRVSAIPIFTDLGMVWSIVYSSFISMKYVVTSDVHLGHPKTPTTHIIASFKKHILNDLNRDIDALFVSGDFFDRLLDLNAKDVHYIVEFFNHLLTYCIRNDICLRVLEGTPSHDWQQSQILVKLNDIRDVKCDLKYHKSLDIDYIDKLGKHVLYIPDEWVNTHEELEKQIQQKLIEHHISQVDIAILHGQFKYQFAGKPYHGFYFREEYFLRLVRGFIHVGHYHTYTYLDRIIANGSLERLAHGEEQPKGYVRVEDDRYSFIENTSAYIYKTLHATASMTLDKLDKQIAKYPADSHIRLLMSKDHPFNVTFAEVKLRYPDHHLKKLIKEQAAEDSSITYILSESEIDLDGKFILDSNIHQLLMDNILAKHQLNPIEHAKLVNYVHIFKETEHAPVTA